MRFNDAFCLRIGRFLAKICEENEVSPETLNSIFVEENQDLIAALLLHADANLGKTVLIPDLDAVALTAFTERRCELTYIDPDYRHWDYLIDPGKTFEVLTWKPGRVVYSGEVLRYFEEKGFHGDPAAFTAWVAARNPKGYHVSLLKEDACWRHPDGGKLFVPYSCFTSKGRMLRHTWLHRDWNPDWVFVAFREVPSSAP